MNTRSSLLALTLAFGLTACGDNVENVYQTGVEAYSSEDDLPKCSKDNENELAFVKEDLSTRVCMDGEWVSSKDTVYLEGGDFSCTTVELKDKSGLKIVCNGDSIGVVLNGEKGEAGKNGKDGEDGADGEDGKDAVLPQDTLEADSERIPMSMDSIVGLTQKGPFLKGSTVYLYELSDGRTLKQTNGNFTSNITTDNGRYKFSARDLVSQYAMVVVDGNYRNEVTGVPSNAPIRLKAITDMRKRSSVNVNLLTHMEFDRVYHLVTRGDKDGKKLTVKKAKQQAQKEILKQFHIELGDNTDAEDMDVFGKSDADAALLAVSVLLQGDSNETALSVLLTEISNSIELNGEWNDSATKAHLADWALKADTENRLAQFRKNVADWHLGDGVPDFEKLVRNYVGIETGLGVCGEKISVGTFAHIPNSNSAYYAQAYDSVDASKNSLVRLVCDGEGGDHWRIATAFERDTKGWADTTAGAVKKGNIDTSLTYVFEDSKWRHGTNLDGLLGFGCTQVMAANDSIYKASETAWYKCSDTTVVVDGKAVHSAWHLMDGFEKDMIYWNTMKGIDTTELAGLLMEGENSGKIMVWDDGILREATDNEILLKKACVTSMYWSKDSLWNTLTYTCTGAGWSKTGTFVDKGRTGSITYKGVQIGTQTWMAENLNYEVKNSGCLYGSESNCDKYGRLYNWSSAMDSSGLEEGNSANGCGAVTTCSPTYPVRGICPEGWHLPDTTEWTLLFKTVGGPEKAGKYLKAASDWKENGYGTDAYSFSVLPGSAYITNANVAPGITTSFWSSTEFNEWRSEKAYGVTFGTTDKVSWRDPMPKEFGFYVRCVKDE